MTKQYVGKWNGESFDIDPSITFRTGVGLSHTPQFTTPPPYNENFLPTWAKILGYVELTICLTFSVFCVLWLIYNRQSTVVVNSQGPLMGIICLGCLLASFAILMFTIDDNPEDPTHINVDRACMAGPTLLSLGLTASLVSLTAKTYRIFSIFKAKALRQVRFGLQRVLALVVLGVVVVLILLIAWNIAAPLKWVRTIEFTDARGSPTYSSGYCAGTTALATTFVVLILLAYLGSLVLTALLAYKVRDVPSDYQESKYVAMILISLVQIYVVAIPSTVAVYSVVIARFLLMTTIVFLTVMVILGLMFVPKIFKLGKVKEDMSHKGTSDPKRGSLEKKIPSVRKQPSSRQDSRIPGSKFGGGMVVSAAPIDHHFAPQAGDSERLKVVENDDTFVVIGTANIKNKMSSGEGPSTNKDLTKSQLSLS
jgi:hypothetical protein